MKTYDVYYTFSMRVKAGEIQASTPDKALANLKVKPKDVLEKMSAKTPINLAAIEVLPQPSKAELAYQDKLKNAHKN